MASAPAPAVAGMRSARTTMCGRCGTFLYLPRGARSVRCPLCHAVTGVQRRGSGLQDFLKGLIYSLMSPPEQPRSSWVDWLPDSYPRKPDRKRALLVGIGYCGTKHELKGTHNDVCSMGTLLRERFGFRSESILVLTEEEKDPNRVPTLRNLRLAMRWLVQGCDTGDALSLVFHFAGRSFNGELCPLDFEGAAGGVIPEYEINETIVRPLGPGAKLHAVLDTYNNGTVGLLDLPFICRMNRIGQCVWEDHRAREAGMRKGTSGGLVVSISGCRDSLNPGTIIGTSSVGAITYYFVKAVETEPAGTTYGRLINVIRADIRPEPELASTELFDIYLKPFLL